MLPLFSNPLNISLPSPTRLPTFCFEWADLICTFAPSHGEKHLCATKDKQVHYLLILIFQFYAVFSYKKRTMGVDPKKSKTLSLPKATHKFRQSLRVYGRWFHRKPGRCYSRFLQVPDNIEYALFARQYCRRGTTWLISPCFQCKVCRKRRGF